MSIALLPAPPKAAVPAIHRAPDGMQRLEILGESARYDASCASSGSSVQRAGARTGNVSQGGICHSWSADGRCISLLKVLFTNACRYNCAYCVNRCGNDHRRASFTVRELVDLTLHFYRRNYIEGLFLSSGIERSADHTMENLVRVAEELRLGHGFGGYIHLKAIPGADPALVARGGRVADRISVNIELPSEKSLRTLAPDKSRETVLRPMGWMASAIEESRTERRRHRSFPAFAPAGQSTQLIVGASPESDRHILRLSEGLYGRFDLKRVYYSAYVPVNDDSRLPALPMPPLRREHRLYQADWLLRFYGFDTGELFDDGAENLDAELDPKTDWALRHPERFPIEINRASLEELLRIPGVGHTSARRIVATRRHGALRFEDLRKMGAVLKRARYFVTCRGRYAAGHELDPFRARMELLHGKRLAGPGSAGRQLSLFD